MSRTNSTYQASPQNFFPFSYEETIGESAPDDFLYVKENHLGNVLSVVSDRKLGVDNNSDNIVDYYLADVVSTTDYYAFGAPMPGRQFNSPSYRYGFNGKENDNEVKGSGNQQDYGFRIYDPRLGRFLSVDPLTRTYPMLTPYQYASNSPIQFIDVDGLEGGETPDKKTIPAPNNTELNPKKADPASTSPAVVPAFLPTAGTSAGSVRTPPTPKAKNESPIPGPEGGVVLSGTLKNKQGLKATIDSKGNISVGAGDASVSSSGFDAGILSFSKKTITVISEGTINIPGQEPVSYPVIFQQTTLEMGFGLPVLKVVNSQTESSKGFVLQKQEQQRGLAFGLPIKVPGASALSFKVKFLSPPTTTR